MKSSEMFPESKDALITHNMNVLVVAQLQAKNYYEKNGTNGRIIQSLLDTDLYKFNMNQVMFHKHSNLVGEYHFKCRSKDVKFTWEMYVAILVEIEHLCSLKFTEDELDYLKSIRFLSYDYVEFLRLWRPIREYVHTYLTKDDELRVIVKGPLFSAMQFEIYLLEIINEIYFNYTYKDEEEEKMYTHAEKLLASKIDKFKEGKYNFKFAEFGCRRRLSRDWQDHVVNRLRETKCMNGTSNVYLAKKYNLIPIGTYAHEYVQMFQGINDLPLAYTNNKAMEDWFDEYQGDNGIALTDTLTTDLFLKDFTFKHANCFKGVRHDSGDPYEWGEKMIKHYEKYKIDPKTKTLLFSDSLDCDKAQAIHEHFKDRINVVFGIGTHLSNHTNKPALNIVIKLQKVNDRPVAKISDTPGKTMCLDDKFFEYLQESVKFRLEREK